MVFHTTDMPAFTPPIASVFIYITINDIQEERNHTNIYASQIAKDMSYVLSINI